MTKNLPDIPTISKPKLPSNVVTMVNFALHRVHPGGASALRAPSLSCFEIVAADDGHQ
jgi:hypothetical protein